MKDMYTFYTESMPLVPLSNVYGSYASRQIKCLSHLVCMCASEVSINFQMFTRQKDSILQ